MANRLFANTFQWIDVLPVRIGEFAITDQGFYFFPQAMLVDPEHEEQKQKAANLGSSAGAVGFGLLGSLIFGGAARTFVSPASPARMIPSGELAPSLHASSALNFEDIAELDQQLDSALRARIRPLFASVSGPDPLKPHRVLKADMTRLRCIGPTAHPSGYKAVFLHANTSVASRK